MRCWHYSKTSSTFELPPSIRPIDAEPSSSNTIPTSAPTRSNPTIAPSPPRSTPQTLGASPHSPGHSLHSVPTLGEVSNQVNSH